MKPLAIFAAYVIGFGTLFVYLLWGRGGPALVWGGAAAGTLGSILLLGAVTGVLKTARLRAAFGRSRANCRPADGQLTVVDGVIFDREGEVVAPFSGEPCLAYEYDIYRTLPGSKRRTPGEFSDPAKEPAAFGIGSAKLAIRTSLGEFGLSGVPMLDRFEANWIRDVEGRDRAQHFLETGTFKRLSVLSSIKMIDDLVSLVNGAEGGRLDWKSDKPIDLTDSQWQICEKRIKPGTRVTVVGDYDARRGNLKPGSSSTDTSEIVPGSLEEARKLLVGSQMATAVLGGIIGSLFVGGTVVAMMIAGAPVSSAALPFKGKPFKEAIIHGDPAIVRELLDAGADPNSEDSLGSPVIFNAHDPEMVEALLDAGALTQETDHNGYTRLYYAALRGEPKIAELLIKAGADVERGASGENGERGETPLAAAIRGGHQDIVAMLVSAGAIDARVTADSGTPLDQKSEAFSVVREYLNALQRRDLAAASAFWESKTDQERVAGADPDIWAKSRPARPELVKGFENNSEATISVTGEVKYGRMVWNYQLKRSGGVWRLVREWEGGEK